MRNQLYKFIIKDVTNYCYQNSLNYFPTDSTILDVGIGNGIMMKNFHSLIKSKRLQITGIDINQSYLNHCECLIRTYHLENFIEIHLEPVETYEPRRNGYFDFILFSMSFMLFDNQQMVLDRVKNWLKPGGKIVFFQTMFKKRFRSIEFIKPRLKYITTIDFGQLIYEKDFFALLNENDLVIVEDRLIKREWFKGEYRMIVTVNENGKKSDDSPLRSPL